jgi:hypothetical protein
MKTRTGALASAMLVAASSTGCYTTWDIPHHELETLNGYHVPKPAVVLDKEDALVELDADTQLWLQLHHDSEWIKTEAAAAYAEGPVLTVLRQGKEGPLRVDLSEVTSARLRRYSPGKTTALVFGVVLGAAAAVAATYGIVYAVGQSFKGWGSGAWSIGAPGD